MKIQNNAVRMLIIFTLSLAVTILVIIFYRAIKTKFRMYPEELLLKTSEEVRSRNITSRQPTIVLKSFTEYQSGFDFS